MARAGTSDDVSRRASETAHPLKGEIRRCDVNDPLTRRRIEDGSAGVDTVVVVTVPRAGKLRGQERVLAPLTAT